MLLTDPFLTIKAHNFKLAFKCRCQQFQMQVLQGDYSNLKCFVTLTTVTIYSRFDVKVENTQQLPSEIPLASFFVVLQGKNHTNI